MTCCLYDDVVCVVRLSKVHYQQFVLCPGKSQHRLRNVYTHYAIHTVSSDLSPNLRCRRLANNAAVSNVGASVQTNRIQRLSATDVASGPAMLPCRRVERGWLPLSSSSETRLAVSGRLVVGRAANPQEAHQAGRHQVQPPCGSTTTSRTADRRAGRRLPARRSCIARSAVRQTV